MTQVTKLRSDRIKLLNSGLPDANMEALSSEWHCVTEERRGMLVCHVLLAAACLVPTSIPGARLGLLTEVNKHVIPRKWIYSFLPRIQFYPPEIFINHAQRLDGNLIFLVKQGYKTSGKNGISCLISPLHTCLA